MEILTANSTSFNDGELEAIANLKKKITIIERSNVVAKTGNSALWTWTMNLEKCIHLEMCFVWFT